MNKAYIVLAHQRPAQLVRLIGSLDDGQSDFFVHLDRSCDRAPFERELGDRNRWQFVKAEDGSWGKSGIVKATLNGLRAVAESGQDFGVINLISGQDYPLRSNSYINRFFEANRGRIFMEFFPLPADIWYHRGLDRIYNYHFGDRRRGSRQNASRWITQICNVSIFFKRRFPRGLKPFGGWQWWSMPMGAVNEILRFTEHRPDFLRYHRWSLLPDEMFFQTILLNSKSERIGQNLVNNCLRFLDWDNPNPAAPATITESYFQALIASKSLFARKFDLDRDETIVDQLDAYRAKEEIELQEHAAVGAEAAAVARSEDFPQSPATPGTKKGLFSRPVTDQTPAHPRELWNAVE